MESLSNQKQRPRFLLLSSPDAELVAAAQAGDTQAFDRLVAAHQERVFALAFRMLGDRDEAADVQQETFVRAWRSLRKFRRDSSFATWLHRICVNQWLSRKRKNDRKATEPLDETRLNVTDASAAAEVEKAETAALVRKVLAGMPGHYRAVLVLREMEERSFGEIAEILGCSVASARTRACKARKMLRERLRVYFAEEDK